MLDAEELKKLSIADLFAAQNDVARRSNEVKEDGKAVLGEMNRRYGESVKQSLAQAGKSHGSATLPLQDGFKVRGECKQTVSYDSEGLMALAQTLPWDRVKALFKITFSVPETVYKGLAAAAPELCEQVDKARTTRIAEPAIILMKDA